MLEDQSPGPSAMRKRPRWWLGYLIGGLVSAPIYSLVLFFMLLSGLGYGNGPVPPVQAFVFRMLAFPLLYFGSDPVSSEELFVLLVLNGAIWGLCLVAVWHVVYRLRLA
jgi:hypothetical protein